MKEAVSCFEIRPANEDDLQQLRSLIPGLASKPGTIEPFVAVAGAERGGRDRIAGVAVLQLLPGGGFVERAVFHILVGAEDRRIGIGTELLDRMVEVSRMAGAATLATRTCITEGSEAAEFLSGHGFRMDQPMITYETSPEAIRSWVEPVYDRLRARGKVPGNGRIVSLGESRRDQVREVVLRNLGSSSPVVAERVQAGVKSYSQQISKVALIGDRVVGANLITWKNALAVVDAHVVEPDWRNTWVSVGLKSQLMRHLVERGTTRLRFTSNPDTHPDTTKMAKRTDAKVISTAGRYVMEL